jgi:hypothetical protein
MDRIRISTKITAAACARFAGPVRAGVLRRSRKPGWAGSVAVLAATVAYLCLTARPRDSGS